MFSTPLTGVCRCLHCLLFLYNPASRRSDGFCLGKYVWSRLPHCYKSRRNVGNTNQIAERSIITKLLRVSHDHLSFLNEMLSRKSVSESCELNRLRPNQERVISFGINDGFRHWSLKCTGQLEQNRKHMLCRITVKLQMFLRLHR